MRTIGYSMQAICELILKEFEIKKDHWTAYIDYDDEDGSAISVNIRTCEANTPGAVDASQLPRPNRPEHELPEEVKEHIYGLLRDRLEKK